MTDFMAVWDYATDFSDYPLVYPNIVPTLQENLKFFRDAGVKDLLSQGDWQGWHAHYGELKSYLISKWLWNPDLPGKPLVREFLEGVYGKAAPIVERDFVALCKLPADPVARPLHVFQDPRSPKNAFDDAWLEASDVRWAAAEKAVEDDPDALYNVRMGRFAVDYTRFLRNGVAGRLWADPDRDRYARDVVAAAGLAKRIQSALKLAEEHRNRVKLSEVESREQMLRELFKRVANPAPPPSEQTRFVFDEMAFKCGVPAWGGMTDDPLASNGRALKLENTHWMWAGSCPFNQFAFDTNRLYEVRVRLRIDRLSGPADPSTGAATAGVYDDSAKKELARISLSPADVKDGYAWYELDGAFRPNDVQYLYVAPGWFDKTKSKSNPLIGGVWIDQVEFSIAETKGRSK